MAEKRKSKGLKGENSLKPLDNTTMSSAEKEGKRVSRREFVKGTAVGAVGVAAAGVLAGCAPAATPTPTTGPEATQTGSPRPVIQETVTTVPQPVYEVYDADILVIGGGPGAICATFEAIALGSNVIVVDKGPYGFSGGATGLHWGVMAIEPNPDTTFKYAVWGSDGLINQKQLREVVDVGQDIQTQFIEYGTASYARLPDGSLLLIQGPDGRTASGWFPRYDTNKIRWQGARIFDRTMITDFLINKGRCVGAMGIDLCNGTFRVFRAKSTIVAAGPYPWLWGWVTVSPHTANSPDNTGDLDAIAYRHGCGIQDPEFWDITIGNLEPTGIANSITGGFAAISLMSGLVCDKDGDFWMRDIPLEEMTRPRFCQEIAKKVAEGKGGPGGGVYLDLTSEEARRGLMGLMVRNIRPWREKFGIDIAKERIEIGFRIIEQMGHPVANENYELEIPGLFFAVPGGKASAPVGPGDGVWAAAGGKVAARNAVKSAEVINGLGVDWEQVKEEFDRVLQVLYREVDNPLRPHVVRHHIQDACYKALSVLKNGADLQAGIDELERIRTEELPKMYVQRKSKAFNLEWKEALENYNLLDLGELCMRASLFREESRGPFMRTDFSNRDDENWLCNVVVKKGPDGKPTLEKKPIVWSEIPPEEVKQLLVTGWQG